MWWMHLNNRYSSPLVLLEDCDSSRVVDSSRGVGTEQCREPIQKKLGWFMLIFAQNYYSRRPYRFLWKNINKLQTVFYLWYNILENVNEYRSNLPIFKLRQLNRFRPKFCMESDSNCLLIDFSDPNSSSQYV